MDPDNERVVFFFCQFAKQLLFEKRKSQVVNVAVTFENTAILPPRAHSLFIQRTGPGCKTPECKTPADAVQIGMPQNLSPLPNAPPALQEEWDRKWDRKAQWAVGCQLDPH